jgi:D-aminopeptidase
MIRPVAATVLAWLLVAGGAEARSPVHTGLLPSGPLDGITDVAGVRVGQLTKISGDGPLRPGIGPIRTGVTAIVPNADPWAQNPAAGTFVLNGNGFSPASDWIRESGHIESPIVLTDTLDVGRALDGSISWMLARHPELGVTSGVPLPVVYECDDQGLNDIQGRHVSPEDVEQTIDAAKTGPFDRGAVGAGTGMRAFDFKSGIGSSSRVLPPAFGGYTVGVLVNTNMGVREQLVVDGVAVGRRLADQLLPVKDRPPKEKPYSLGRGNGGSIVVILATDAPLDGRELEELAKRASLGMARTGANSQVSSGDFFLAFSTSRTYPQEGPIVGPAIETDEDRLDALFEAAADATQDAIYDSLFSAHTMTGKNGTTFYALPWERVAPLLGK